MQDTLLGVFLVALGLLTNPMNDPGVEERETLKFGERLLTEEEKLYQEVAPVSGHVTRPDDKGNLDDVRNIQVKPHKSDEFVIEEDIMSDLEDVTTAKQDFKENGDPICPQKLDEAEQTLETSGINPEQKEDSQLEVKQTDDDQAGSFRDSHRPETSWGKDFLSYMWNVFSMMSMICFFRKYFKENSQITRDKVAAFPVTRIAGDVSLPDSDTLLSFHSWCVQGSSLNKGRKHDFLEGFVTDLLDAMRSLCSTNAGMAIGDFHMVNAFEINVPFSPPEPYRFQCLVNNHASDLLPDMQVCGQVKVVQSKEIQNGCHCQSSAADDMVCLLHSDNEKVHRKLSDVCDGLLCSKSTALLSKSRVSRWFQSTIKQAWGRISHKYEFELNIRYFDGPGALVIRFRSGKVIRFQMNPVVKLNTEAHFYATPCTPGRLDTFWTLSLTSYENNLLQHLAKRLPEDSCHIQTLEIACFLLRRQTALSGSSTVKDFHFKTALMHLLLTREPSQWKADSVTHRLQDLLDFMERSLVKKQLQHVIIGNPLRQKIFQLPAEFTQAKPVNLFHPLVVHNCIFRNSIMHFQEMLRNAHMLIQDYVDRCNNSSV